MLAVLDTGNPISKSIVTFISARYKVSKSLISKDVTMLIFKFMHRYVVASNITQGIRFADCNERDILLSMPP